MKFIIKEGMAIPIHIMFAVFSLSLLLYIAGYVIAGKARYTSSVNKGLIIAAVGGGAMVISIAIMYTLAFFT